MTRLSERGARRARAAAFSISAVVLALGAHVTAGGSAPMLPAVVLLALLVDGVALCAARRRVGPVTIGAGLLASQAGLHTAFTLLAPSAHMTGGHAAAQHAAGPMLAAHLVATLVLAAVLAWGEGLLWRLAARTLPALPGAPFRPLSTTTLAWTVTPYLGRPLATPACSLSRRGPPRPTAAATA